MINKLMFALFFSLVIISCHKDYESGEEITTVPFLPQIKTQVEGSIVGYVYDESAKPVEGATVEIYGASTKTDKFGVFVFEKKALDQSGTYIRISKEGYMTGSDKVFPAGGIAYSKTKLFGLHKNDKLDAGAGGTISVKNGGKLVFLPNSFMYPDGKEYTGVVFISSVFISPDSPDLADEMPGELLGGNTSGITSVLGTAGMFGAELIGEHGEKLKIKTGSKVKFFIPAKSTNKPTEVPLWHFDQNRGYWIEEGVARLVNQEYVGEVSHFSFWNVDVPFPLIELCGTIENETGKPVFGVQVCISADGLGTRYGYVDSYGNFCGLVPKDKKLTITVKRHGCDEVLKTIEVGPFSEKTNLNPIIVSEIALSVEGEVKCHQDLVTNGVVVIQYGGQTYPILTEDNGRYYFEFYGCKNDDEITLFAYDITTFKASVPETIAITNGTVKDISICTTACNLDGSIKDQCSYLEMIVTQGSGNVYNFIWSNGDSTNRTNRPLPLEPKVICVTVTDPAIANCSQEFCYNYGGALRLIIESECNNPMQVYPSGGVPPYRYLWHNGQTTEKVVLADGENYCVTVTDQVGCSVKHCGNFTDLMISNTISNCQKHLFNINSSFYTQAFIYTNGAAMPVSSLMNLSIFNTGFNFAVSIQKGQCSQYAQFSLPQFKGLTIKSVRNTTCLGCTDGFIDVGIDSQAACVGCMVGGVKILPVNDLLNDLSPVNALGLMLKGEYYVVVEDVGTGCYIAFEKVTIN